MKSLEVKLNKLKNSLTENNHVKAIEAFLQDHERVFEDKTMSIKEIMTYALGLLIYKHQMYNHYSDFMKQCFKINMHIKQLLQERESQISSTAIGFDESGIPIPDSVFGSVTTRTDYLTEQHLNDALQHLSSFNIIKHDLQRAHRIWLEVDHPIFFNPESIFPSLKIPIADLLLELDK